MNISGPFSKCKEIFAKREESEVRNLEYSIDGGLFTYTTETTLKVYASEKMELKNVITAAISHSKFFHNHTMIQAHGSSLYYHSLHDNKYLQKYEHGSSITSLSTNPCHDTFMSVGSPYVNLWDVRVRKPVRQLRAPNHIGAIGTSNKYCLFSHGLLKIFDFREEHGPLATLIVTPGFFNSVWFTADATKIVLASSNSYAFISELGSKKSIFPLEGFSVASTTADSSTLVCTSKRHVIAYDIENKSIKGRMNIDWDLCTEISVSPSALQVAIASGPSIKVYR